MNIGINLLGESKFKAGTGRYAYEIIKALSEIDRENKYFVFFPSCHDSEFLISSSRFIYIKVPAIENVFVRRIVEQLVLPFYILKVKITRGLNVVHSTNNIAPIVIFKLNTVTIHDMARWKTKNDKWYKNNILKLFLFCSVWISRKIITVSDASKRDIAAITGVKQEKIVSSFNSVDRKLFRPIGEDDASKTLRTYNIEIKRPFIMALSSIEHRKNYPRLVKALKRSCVDLDLFICGKKANGYDDLKKAIEDENLHDRVKIIIFIPDELYISLLSKSLFYVFVSIFEGAGLTPLEAMACRKAVLVSDLPVIHEYLGEAAIYVDPFSIDSIADGIKKLFNDGMLRENLSEKGFIQVQKFDWKNHAEALLKIWNSR